MTDDPSWTASEEVSVGAARDVVLAALDDLHALRARRGLNEEEEHAYERLCFAERALYAMVEPPRASPRPAVR